MNPDLKRQLWQSVGQFFIVFLSGMVVFKDWNAVVQMGVLNAVYQPVIQGLISVCLIWGISKMGAKP